MNNMDYIINLLPKNMKNGLLGYSASVTAI